VFTVNTGIKAPQHHRYHPRRRAFAFGRDIACFDDIVPFLQTMDYIRAESVNENEVCDTTSKGNNNGLTGAL
jgi:hypothetical protein